MTSGGCEVDVGGVGGGGGGEAVFNYKFICNKPKREFLTGEAKYCRPREHLGSGPSLECLMMKSNTLFERGSPPPPTSTSRPPDVIHMTGVPRPSPFFTLFHLRVLY